MFCDSVYMYPFFEMLSHISLYYFFKYLLNIKNTFLINRITQLCK